jgi:hypothetical protein
MPLSVSLNPRDSDPFFNMDEEDDDDENEDDSIGVNRHNRSNQNDRLSSKKAKKEEKTPFNALVSRNSTICIFNI